MSYIFFENAYKRVWDVYIYLLWNNEIQETVYTIKLYHYIIKY